MYSIDWLRVFPRSSRDSAGVNPADASAVDDANSSRRRLPRLSPTVWALGFTSLLTDISSEMVASVLPIYLVLYLGMSPLMFGLVDGIYQAAAAIVWLLGAMVSLRFAPPRFLDNT